MIDENCIFCKIANGEIPSKTVYEDDDFRVILDLGPATKGHALILPKDHYNDVYELPEDLTGKAFILAKKISLLLKKKLNCDGLNLIQNNGRTAGQTVFHFHIHVIPRYHDDHQHIGWNPQEISQEELEEIQKEIFES